MALKDNDKLKLECLHPAPFEAIRTNNIVEYYCADCKHTWTVDKSKIREIRSSDLERFTFC